MNDQELELAILQRYVEHYDAIGTQAKKCARELDMKEVIAVAIGRPVDKGVKSPFDLCWWTRYVKRMSRSLRSEFGLRGYSSVSSVLVAIEGKIRKSRNLKKRYE